MENRVKRRNWIILLAREAEIEGQLSARPGTGRRVFSTYLHLLFKLFYATKSITNMVSPSSYISLPPSVEGTV